MKRARFLALIAVAVVLSAAAASSVNAQTAGELLDQMNEKMAACKDWQSDIKMEMHMVMDMGEQTMEMFYDVTGTVQVKGNNQRYEMNMEGLSIAGDQEIPMNMSMLTVNDGKTMWQEMQPAQMPQKMITKTSITRLKEELSDGVEALLGQQAGVDMSEQLKKMREFSEVTLTGTEMIDGRQTHVLDVAISPELWDKVFGGEGGTGMLSSMGKDVFSAIRVYIDKDDLFMRKMVVEDKAGEEIMTVEMTNFKANAGIDDSVFEYEPPSDATVTDITDMMIPVYRRMLGVIKEEPTDEGQSDEPVME